MDRPFTPVPDLTALEQLFADSGAAPVVLFQHDPFCPTSARAYREMAQLRGTVHLVNVARQHDLARSIATRTGIRHESPQVLVLRGGQAVWSASHSAITADTVGAAVSDGTAAHA